MINNVFHYICFYVEPSKNRKYEKTLLYLVSIIDALIDYDTNYRSQEHGFELVVQKYNLNEKDVYFLAFSIETFDYLIDSIPMETRSGKKLVSCATAVVGSVITTVGATTIATGWGLGLFLVGKAVSLVGVAMCAT